MAAWAVAMVVVAAAVAAAASAKECTNIPTQLSSHTVRARLQASPGAAEWRLRELFHDHLNPTDEAAWMDLMPPPRAAAGAQHDHVHEELDWAALYRSLKGQRLPAGGAAPAAGPFLEEVPLRDVRLDHDGDAAYGRAQRTNLEYLLLLDPDRLVWSFRTQAGLPAPGEPYGGWEGPDVELRGHFVGKHSLLPLLSSSRSVASRCASVHRPDTAITGRHYVVGAPAGRHYCAARGLPLALARWRCDMGVERPCGRCRVGHAAPISCLVGTGDAS